MVKLLICVFLAIVTMSVAAADLTKRKGEYFGCLDAESTTIVSRRVIVKINDGGLTKSMLAALGSISDAEDGYQTAENRRSKILESYRQQLNSIKDNFLSAEKYRSIHLINRTVFGPEMVFFVQNCAEIMTLLGAKEVENVAEDGPLGY